MTNKFEYLEQFNIGTLVLGLKDEESMLEFSL